MYMRPFLPNILQSENWRRLACFIKLVNFGSGRKLRFRRLVIENFTCPLWLGVKLLFPLKLRIALKKCYKTELTPRLPFHWSDVHSGTGQSHLIAHSWPYYAFLDDDCELIGLVRICMGMSGFVSSTRRFWSWSRLPLWSSLCLRLGGLFRHVRRLKKSLFWDFGFILSKSRGNG